MTEEKIEKINSNTPANRGNRPLSDQVIIEIVQAFKDIIIEFIDKRYGGTTE